VRTAIKALPLRRHIQKGFNQSARAQIEVFDEKFRGRKSRARVSFLRANVTTAERLLAIESEHPLISIFMLSVAVQIKHFL
jgi:hypothetical protein